MTWRARCAGRRRWRGAITRRSRTGCGSESWPAGWWWPSGAAGDAATFAAKIDELVERSHGRIRADVAHEKLVALGYQGSSRTTRRWVAEAKRRWRREHGRRTRPWIPEPGLWMQWDYGDGPVVDGRRTVLFCAWLAWSRFRVVVPLRDKTLPSVVIGLDRALRRFGGVPTYALTDNEKTVSVDHVCGIAVRNPQIVSVARHYGRDDRRRACPPTRRARAGRRRRCGSRRPTWSRPITTSGPPMRSSAELEAACEQWMARREHAAAPRHDGAAGDPPGGGARAAAPPPEGAAHGVFRGDPEGQLAVDDLGGRCPLLGAARADRPAGVGSARRRGADRVHADRPAGPREVARHGLTTPGRPAINDRALPAHARRARLSADPAPAQTRSRRSCRSARPPRGG